MLVSNKQCTIPYHTIPCATICCCVAPVSACCQHLDATLANVPFWGCLFSNARRKWPSALTCMVSIATFHVSTLVSGIHEVGAWRVGACLPNVPHPRAALPSTPQKGPKLSFSAVLKIAHVAPCQHADGADLQFMSRCCLEARGSSGLSSFGCR